MDQPVDDDTPMTLKEACEVIFRNTITPATLRAEATRGRLAIERIGRRDFVTRAAIKEMREACKAPRAPTQYAPRQTPVQSVSERVAAARAAAEAALRTPYKEQQAEAERSRLAQARVMATLAELRKSKKAKVTR